MAVDTVVGPARQGEAWRGGVRPWAGHPRCARGRSPLGRAGLTLALFALPSLILLVLLNLFPVIYSFIQSFQDGTPSTLPTEATFVGLQNYVERPHVRRSSSQSDALHDHLHGRRRVRVVARRARARAAAAHADPGRRRSSRCCCCCRGSCPVVVSATSWNWLVATPQSPIPMILASFGLGDVNFLGDPVLAQVVVCVFKVWISFPFMMMMMSSALARVDNNVYEAARMDGASAWQAFTGVTLPIISRTTYISWVLMTIFCVNDFPTIFLLTQGGPSGRDDVADRAGVPVRVPEPADRPRDRGRVHDDGGARDHLDRCCTSRSRRRTSNERSGPSPSAARTSATARQGQAHEREVAGAEGPVVALPAHPGRDARRDHADPGRVLPVHAAGAEQHGHRVHVRELRARSSAARTCSSGSATA